MSLFKDIMNYVSSFFGATLTSDFSIINPKEGYAVSLKGSERVVPYKEDEGYYEQILSDYKESVNIQNNEYVGMWHKVDEGTIVLDKSIIVPNKSVALDLAKENEQEAIYDFKNSELIYL